MIWGEAQSQCESHRVSPKRLVPPQPSFRKQAGQSAGCQRLAYPRMPSRRPATDHASFGLPAIGCQKSAGRPAASILPAIPPRTRRRSEACNHHLLGLPGQSPRQISWLQRKRIHATVQPKSKTEASRPPCCVVDALPRDCWQTSNQPFTSTGPVPCGRSFSDMMPSRLATSV